MHIEIDVNHETGKFEACKATNHGLRMYPFAMSQDYQDIRSAADNFANYKHVKVVDFIAHKNLEADSCFNIGLAAIVLAVSVAVFLIERFI